MKLDSQLKQDDFSLYGWLTIMTLVGFLSYLALENLSVGCRLLMPGFALCLVFFALSICEEKRKLVRSIAFILFAVTGILLTIDISYLMSLSQGQSVSWPMR